MESVLDFLENAFALVLFCMALGLLLFYKSNFTSLMKSSKECLYDTRVVYQSVNLDNDEQNSVTYSELCSILSAPLSYDTTVTALTSSINCTASTYNYMLFDFTSVPKADYYYRIYNYQDGNIVSVLYQGVD